MDRVFISDFQSCLPPYQEAQSRVLELLADAHERSLAVTKLSIPVRKLVSRYGVKENHIASRYFDCADLYLPASERTIYHIDEQNPAGVDIQKQHDFFKVRSLEVFEKLFDENSTEPEHLMHVTCTGYISPSAAQRLVARRNWKTNVTHSYHMGCYASLPTLRMAWGQVKLGQAVDVVHTEMCSLHMNPALHTPEQLVVQTLFADGHIKYRVSAKAEDSSFRCLKIKEALVPHSEDDITWLPGPTGMVMNLSREVPQKIRAHIREFTLDLLGEGPRSTSDLLQNAIFAIHPGGPRIIETVAEALELKPEQLAHSKEILRTRGNMSSSTLPHIWQAILSSPSEPETPVVSLAFGPGLTVFGALFEKVK